MMKPEEVRTVKVETDSGSYEIRIGEGLLDSLGNCVCELTTAERCVIVSGENVFPLYGEQALQSLRKAGLQAEQIVFSAGENTKSLENYAMLLNYIAEKKLSRSDCLVALGGGVTGDLTGFAAATYQRGIRYIQVPTSLLAAVDSSVGGKTAINLASGKNQVGAFWQPVCVLCDTSVLQSLPEREMRAGLAEVIKYAVMQDADLFDQLQQHDIDLPKIIESCVRIKAEIVAEDERDTGRRRLLNLGHSFGHAIESRSEYRLLHGEAVAVGLSMISRAAARLGWLDPKSAEAVVALLRDFGLPTEPEWSADELFPLLLSDKKFYSGKLHLVVPKSIGWCEILPVSVKELRVWLESAYE